MTIDSIVIKLNGEDVGVRENSNGEVFMDKAIYLGHPRILKAVARLRAARIVENKPASKNKKNK